MADIVDALSDAWALSVTDAFDIAAATTVAPQLTASAIASSISLCVDSDTVSPAAVAYDTNASAMASTAC